MEKKNLLKIVDVLESHNEEFPLLPGDEIHIKIGEDETDIRVMREMSKADYTKKPNIKRLKYEQLVELAEEYKRIVMEEAEVQMWEDMQNFELQTEAELKAELAKLDNDDIIDKNGDNYDRRMAKVFLETGITKEALERFYKER